MKHLVLIRHAKSSWDTPLKDHDRPLAERGIKRAKILANILAHKLDISKFKWYSSTANRAMSTARIFHNKFTNLIHPKEELYTFSSEDLQKTIASFSDKEDKIVLFGHNPAFTELTNYLGTETIDNLPTAGIVYIQLDILKWNDLSKGKTQFILTHLNISDE